MNKYDNINNSTPANTLNPPIGDTGLQSAAAPKIPAKSSTALSTLEKLPDPMLDAVANPLLTDNEKDKKSSFVSKGEHLHKWGTYLGIDWLFNTATGVSFAYWGKHTEAGKKYWSGPITEFFSKTLKPFIKEEAILHKSAGYGNMFMSIIAGGMFTIPPLMVLENNKVKHSIVKSLDTKIYGKDAVENDPKLQDAHEAIKTAPKKDFSSGLGARFVSLAPLLAIVLIPITKKISNRFWFNHIEHASENAAIKLGLSAEKMFKSVPAAEAKERWKFIHEAVAMDFGLGIPYAILHEFFFSKFANGKAKPAADDGVQTTTPAKSSAVAAFKKEAPINEDSNQKKFAQMHAPSGNKNRLKSASFTDKVRYEPDGTSPSLIN